MGTGQTGFPGLAGPVRESVSLHLCKHRLSLFAGDTSSPYLSGSLGRLSQVYEARSKHSTRSTRSVINTEYSVRGTPGAALMLGGQRLLAVVSISLALFPAGLYVLVGAGALMMAVGFFGCCGATRESQCVLGSVSGESGEGTVLKGAGCPASSASSSAG